MTATVKRDTRIEVQRADVGFDAMGEEVKTWSPIARPMAAMHYGRGEERRQAGAMQAQQSVNVNVLASPRTRGIRITDRLVVNGAAWDIVGISPIGRREIDFTAVRAP